MHFSKPEIMEGSGADGAADEKLNQMLSNFEPDTKDQFTKMRDLMRQEDKSGTGKLSMAQVRKPVDRLLRSRSCPPPPLMCSRPCANNRHQRGADGVRGVAGTSVKIAGLTPGMIKTAIERGDTDGTGDNINYEIVFSKLVNAIFESHNTKNIATAKVGGREQGLDGVSNGAAIWS